MQKIILGRTNGKAICGSMPRIPTPGCREVAEISVFSKILLMPECNRVPITKKTLHLYRLLRFAKCFHINTFICASQLSMRYEYCSLSRSWFFWKLWIHCNMCTSGVQETFTVPYSVYRKFGNRGHPPSPANIYSTPLPKYTEEWCSRESGCSYPNSSKTGSSQDNGEKGEANSFLLFSQGLWCKAMMKNI